MISPRGCEITCFCDQASVAGAVWGFLGGFVSLSVRLGTALFKLLVGAPLAFVRGPFVAEGILQGGLGALLAMLALAVVYLFLRARYAAEIASVLGGPLAFLPAPATILVIAGGMLLGCLGGARRMGDLVREFVRR